MPLKTTLCCCGLHKTNGGPPLGAGAAPSGVVLMWLFRGEPGTLSGAVQRPAPLFCMGSKEWARVDSRIFGSTRQLSASMHPPCISRQADALVSLKL